LGIFGKDERGEQHGLARLVMPQWQHHIAAGLGANARSTDHCAGKFFCRWQGKTMWSF